VRRAFSVLALAAFAVVSLPAQVQMPNPKEISGKPLPASDLPAGTFSVRVVRGGFDKNLADQPVEIIVGGKSRQVKTDAGGRAQISGLAPGTVVRAVAVVDKEGLTSEEITMGQTGIRVVLVATDPEVEARAAEDRRLAAAPATPGSVVLGPQTRVIIQHGDETLSVFYVLEIVNSARTRVDIGGPLMIDLPDGARGGGLLEGSSPQGKLNGTRLIVVGPFAPGSTVVQLGFELPTGGSEHLITQRFPVSVAKIEVAMERQGQSDLVSSQLRDRREMSAEGQRAVVATAGPIEAGGALALTVNGLPHHPRWPRYLALTMALGLVAVGLREGFRRA
jgi:hypothetical protein